MGVGELPGDFSNDVGKLLFAALRTYGLGARFNRDTATFVEDLRFNV